MSSDSSLPSSSMNSSPARRVSSNSTLVKRLNPRWGLHPPITTSPVSDTDVKEEVAEITAKVDRLKDNIEFIREQRKLQRLCSDEIQQRLKENELLRSQIKRAEKEEWEDGATIPPDDTPQKLGNGLSKHGVRYTLQGLEEARGQLEEIKSDYYATLVDMEKRKGILEEEMDNAQVKNLETAQALLSMADLVALMKQRRILEKEKDKMQVELVKLFYDNREASKGLDQAGGI